MYMLLINLISYNSLARPQKITENSSHDNGLRNKQICWQANQNKRQGPKRQTQKNLTLIARLN
jgi:hypothetical protein